MSEKSEMGLGALQVWQRAMVTAGRIHKEVLPLLPAEEKRAMSSQLRRAAQSLPANLAEGHGRYYYQDNIRFWYIVRGSLQEVFTYSSLAHDIGYLPQALFVSLEHEFHDLRRMINSYITYLKTSKLGASEPGANLFLEAPSSDYSISKEDNRDLSQRDDGPSTADNV